MSLKMRFGMYTFLTVFAVGNSALAGAQAPTTQRPNFTLTLVAPNGPFKLGEPIHLVVKITNTTDDHDVYVLVPPGEAWGDEIVGVDLTDSAGVPVPKWRDLKRQANGGKREMNGGSFRSDDIPPQQVHEREVRLEKVFKITAAGHYTVRVGRWDTNTHILVKSEPIGIDIVPAS